MSRGRRQLCLPPPPLLFHPPYPPPPPPPSPGEYLSLSLFLSTRAKWSTDGRQYFLKKIFKCREYSLRTRRIQTVFWEKNVRPFLHLVVPLLPCFFPGGKVSCVQCNNGSFLPLPSSSLSFRSAKNNFGPEEKKGKGGIAISPHYWPTKQNLHKWTFFGREKVLIIWPWIECKNSPNLNLENPFPHLSKKGAIGHEKRPKTTKPLIPRQLIPAKKNNFQSARWCSIFPKAKCAKQRDKSCTNYILEPHDRLETSIAKTSIDFAWKIID